MRGDVASFRSQVEHGVKYREAVGPLRGGGGEPVGGAGLHGVFLFLLILTFVVTRLPSPAGCATDAFIIFFKVCFFLLYKHRVFIENVTNVDKKKIHL